MKKKKCPQCDKPLPISEFGKSKHTKSGHVSWCRKCRKKKAIAYHKKHPRKKEQYKLKSHYNMTIEEYDERVKMQQGQCAICNKPTKRLVVDHDHKNGEIRGLLCNSCNTGLGHFGDKGEGLTEALSYLGFYTETREKLVELTVLVKGLTEQMTNHLKHHQAITICALGVALSALAGTIILICRGQ